MTSKSCVQINSNVISREELGRKLFSVSLKCVRLNVFRYATGQLIISSTWIMGGVVKDKEEQQENKSDTKTTILLYDLIYRNFFMLICIYEKRMYILYGLIYSYFYWPHGGAKSHRKIFCF